MMLRRIATGFFWGLIVGSAFLSAVLSISFYRGVSAPEDTCILGLASVITQEQITSIILHPHAFLLVFFQSCIGAVIGAFLGAARKTRNPRSRLPT